MTEAITDGRRWEGFSSFENDPKTELLYEIGDGGGYDYSLTALWMIDEDRDTLYLGDTSGCSCTCPWEEIDRLEDLTRIPMNRTLSVAEDAAWKHLGATSHSTEDRLRILVAIRELHRARKG